jgi:dTDP-4-dehydrorhamnose reductase
MKPSSLVVVGGDSAIGRQLSIEAENAGLAVVQTTRRIETVGENRVFLDLEDPTPERFLPPGAGGVVILAARTGYDACEKDGLSEKINIEAPVSLAKAALAQGRRVVFVSSSSVFGGDLPFCNEYDLVAPPSAVYSLQKSEVERRLNALFQWDKLGGVVRLTKVLAPNSSPIRAWRESLARGEFISPFSDMVFAPISVQYAARNLIRIALSEHCGNFHLSNAADINYVAFARQYVAAHNGDIELIVPTTSELAGTSLFYGRRYSALGMVRTQQLIGIVPQKMDEVISDLLGAELS